MKGPYSEYSWEDYLVYGADETKTVVFDPTACLCNQIIFEPLVFAADGGPIIIDVMTEVEYDPGTGSLLFASNRNENIDRQPGVILRLNPTGFSGIKFAGDIVPSTGGNSPMGGGNVNPAGVDFEIDITKIKALQLTNKNGAGVYVLHKITWVEV